MSSPKPRGIEREIETTIKNAIENQIAQDGFADVRVRTFNGATLDEEKQKTMVFITCMPVEVVAQRGNGPWNSTVEVYVETAHLTGKDRDGATMVSLAESVAYALDYVEFTQFTTWLYSLNTRRTGGNYEVENSTNSTIFMAEVKACGDKTGNHV